MRIGISKSRAKLRTQEKRFCCTREPGGAASGRQVQREDFTRQQAQSDHGENTHVEPPEEALAHALEDLAPDPGADHDAGPGGHQQRQVGNEGEARHSKQGDLDQVAQGLAGGLGADEGAPIEAQIEEEGRDQGSRRTNRHVQHAHHAAQDQEATAGIGLLGMGPQQQPSREPGRDQHEDADHGPRRRGRERVGQMQTHPAHRDTRTVVPYDNGSTFCLRPDPFFYRCRKREKTCLQSSRPDADSSDYCVYAASAYSSS